MNTETPQTQFSAALEMVNALVKDFGWAKRRKELEDIQKILREAVENEKKMIDKCHKLRAEKVANSAKVKAAVCLSKEDQETISMLRLELEKAWSTIKQLRQQCLGCKCNMSVKHFGDSSSNDFYFPHEAKTSDQNLFSKLKEEILKLKEQKKSLESEMDSLKQKMDNKERSSFLLREGKKKLLRELDDSKNLMKIEKELEKQLMVYEKEIQTLKKELLAMRKEHDKTIAENEKFKLQIFELEEELADKEKREEEIRTLNVHKVTETMDQEVQTVNTKHTSETVEISPKQIFILRYKRKIKKMASELEKMMNLYNSRGIAIKKLKLKLDTNEESLNSLQTKHIQLKEDFSNKIKCNDMLMEKNGKLQDEIKKFSCSVSMLEEIRDDYVSIMGKQESELHHLKVQFERHLNDEEKENESSSLKTSQSREQQLLVREVERLKQRHREYEDILLQTHRVIDVLFDDKKLKFSCHSQDMKMKYSLAKSLKDKVLDFVDHFKELETKNRILSEVMRFKGNDYLYDD